MIIPNIFLPFLASVVVDSLEHEITLLLMPMIVLFDDMVHFTAASHSIPPCHFVRQKKE